MDSLLSPILVFNLSSHSRHSSETVLQLRSQLDCTTDLAILSSRIACRRCFKTRALVELMEHLDLLKRHSLMDHSKRGTTRSNQLFAAINIGFHFFYNTMKAVVLLQSTTCPLAHRCGMVVAIAFARCDRAQPQLHRRHRMSRSEAMVVLSWG